MAAMPIAPLYKSVLSDFYLKKGLPRMPAAELLAEIRDKKAECLENMIMVFGECFEERK